MIVILTETEQFQCCSPGLLGSLDVLKADLSPPLIAQKPMSLRHMQVQLYPGWSDYCSDWQCKLGVLLPEAWYPTQWQMSSHKNTERGNGLWVHLSANESMIVKYESSSSLFSLSHLTSLLGFPLL